MPRASLLNVPYTGTTTVESKPPPAAWQNIKTTDEMFGAAKGRALVGLGQAISGFGDALSAIDSKNKHETEQAAARDIDTDTMKKYTELDTRFSMMDGKTAVEQADAIEKERQQIKENAIKAAGGESTPTGRIVSRSTTGRYRDSWLRGFEHTTKQVIKYADDSGEARMQAAEEKARVSMSEEDLKEAITITDNETSAKGKRNLWSEERVPVEQHNRRSKTISSFIGNMAQYHPVDAQKYYDKYQRHMNKEARDAVQEAITKGHAARTGKQGVDSAIKGEKPVPPPRREIPPKPLAPTGPPETSKPGAIPTEPKAPDKKSSLDEAPTDISASRRVADPETKAKTAEMPVAPGLLKEGNIDLDARIPVENEDGTISTESSISKNFDGKEVLIPTVVDGKRLSEDEAVEHYKKTGEHLGEFETPEAAEKYAKELSAQQKEKYGDKKWTPEQLRDLKQRRPKSEPAPTHGPTGRPAQVIPGYAPGVTTAVVEHYIVKAARIRGIDPGTALEVAWREGMSNWKSTVPGENSWGPFQLFTGDAKRPPGLGGDFKRDHKKDPSDPSTWKEGVDYALNEVVKNGWGKWYGARAAKITGKMGVAVDAKPVPVGKTEETPEYEDEDKVEERDDVTDAPAKSFMGYAQNLAKGDPDAKAAPGSSVIHAWKGRIRSAVPPHPTLVDIYEKAGPVAGVIFRITSAGQTSDRNPAMYKKPGGWTGTVRHNDGKATDGDILDLNGNLITNRDDPRRLKFLEETARLGAGGTGTGYMGGDGLKVHIGLTGASGEEGKGLGVYSRQSTPAEKAAIERGLADGGHDVGVSARPGGGYRGTSTGGGTVVSDAEPSGVQAGQKYAQAKSAAVEPPPVFEPKPITAETPLSEVNRIIKEYKDDAQAEGHDPSLGRAFETNLRAEYERMKQEKVDAHNTAKTDLEDKIFGKDKKPPIKSEQEIWDDPKSAAQFRAMTGPEQERMRGQIEKMNQTNANRPPTPEDFNRMDALRVAASKDPEILRNMDLSEWPKSMHAGLKKLRENMLTNGANGDAEVKRLNNIIDSREVRFQLERAQINEFLDTQGKQDNPIFIKFKERLMGQLRYWQERNPTKSYPSEEETKQMVNGILREEVVKKPGLKFWGTPITTNETRIRDFEKEMSPIDQREMIDEWNARFPYDQVKKIDEIRPELVWQWRLNRPEVLEYRRKYQPWP